MEIHLDLPNLPSDAVSYNTGLSMTLHRAGRNPLLRTGTITRRTRWVFQPKNMSPRGFRRSMLMPWDTFYGDEPQS